MTEIKDIDSVLTNNTIRTNESYFNLIEFQKYLCNPNNKLSLNNCTITPFYFHDDKGYELYQYDCLINDKGIPFEQYILNLTGKKEISKIPQNIIEMRRTCYINSDVDFNHALTKWVNALLNDTSVKKEVFDIFGVYDKKELYATIY